MGRGVPSIIPICPSASLTLPIVRDRHNRGGPASPACSNLASTWPRTAPRQNTSWGRGIPSIIPICPSASLTSTMVSGSAQSSSASQPTAFSEKWPAFVPRISATCVFPWYWRDSESPVGINEGSLPNDTDPAEPSVLRGFFVSGFSPDRLISAGTRPPIVFARVSRRSVRQPPLLATNSSGRLPTPIRSFKTDARRASCCVRPRLGSMSSAAWIRRRCRSDPHNRHSSTSLKNASRRPSVIKSPRTRSP